MGSTQQILLKSLREVPRQKGKQRLSLTLVFKSSLQEAQPPAFQQHIALSWAVVSGGEASQGVWCLPLAYGCLRRSVASIKVGSDGAGLAHAGAEQIPALVGWGLCGQNISSFPMATGT